MPQDEPIRQAEEYHRLQNMQVRVSASRGEPQSLTSEIRARRVKCDEGKPVCGRCVKAGRQCLGYAPWKDLSPSRNSQSPRSISTVRAADQDEDLYFRIFMEDGRKQSVLPSDVEFWKTLVPQLSQQEPAIRYAAVAIGAFMMQLRAIQGLADPDAPSRSALTYYNKSIQELLSPSTTMKKETALVSNILFTCLECLQGRDTEALGLFHQGRRMFEEYWDSFDGSVPPSPITDGVRHLLSRIRVLALLYGPVMADYTSPITGSPAVSPSGSFDTYEEARTALFYLMGDFHELVAEGSRAKLFHTPQAEILRLLKFERDALQARLHEWKARFWALLEPAQYTQENVSVQIAVLTLQCFHIALSTWLACSLAVDECAFDVHLPSFRQLVGTAEMVIDLLNKSEFKEQPFSLEIGLIAPLYLTVRSCRHPMLRRTAIDLMRRGRRQEGLWEARQTVAISQRMVEIEERGLLEGQWPAEAARLQATHVHPRKTWSDGRKGNMVQFFLMSQGPPEGWDVWDEYFEQ